MSISYGTITITDTTDLGQLSVYLTGSTVRQQVYDGNSNPVTFYPDWSVAGGALIITPHVYFNGQSQQLSNNKIEVAWSKEEGGVVYPNQSVSTFPTSPTTEECPESAVDQSSGYKKIQRPTNLTTNSTGATYTATITYYPIDGDRQTKLQAIATLDITIANNGENGQAGAPAKSLQLIGSGSHFTYTWDGTATGITTISLSTEKSDTVAGIHWYCDDTLITTGGSPYSSLNLSVTTANISTYSPNFHTNKSARFRVVEINSSGQEINNGLIDYFTIYKLQDAQPGGTTYSSYLDNDEETVSEYDGVIDFTNAITTFHLDKGGSNDLVANSGWTIEITDSDNITYTTGKSSFNTLSGSNHNEVTNVTTMTGNVAWIQFNAHNSSSSVSDQIKRFTIVKNPGLISHALRLNSVVANRDTTAAPNGNYSPTQIIVDAIVRTGGGTDSYRVAGVIEATTYYKDGSHGSALTNTTGNPLTIILADKLASGSDPASRIDYIETKLYYNNGIVDTQKIVISCDGIDGEDGTSPWSFMLGNDFDAIATDFGNNTLQDFTIKIPIEAAQGIYPKTIYYGGGNYPTIYAPTILTTIEPKYYLGNTRVITTGSAVDNVRYDIPAGTDIGDNGAIALVLTYAVNSTLSKSYTYKSQPNAIKPIRVLLTPSPSDTFENQQGTITITPIVISGTDEIGSSYWSNPTWQAFVNNTWVNATTVTGITVSNNVLSVLGTAVNGYLGLRFTVTVSKGGVTDSYTEYINLKDIDDPLQVTLHSTVGEQIVNSQGQGVIYARVIRKGDDEDYDIVVPDDMLAIGTSTPTSSTASGKTGYCYVVLNNNSEPTGEVRYYWRSTGSGNWTGYRGNTSNPYKYTYTWTFRDSGNSPYNASASSTPNAVKYAMTHNQQFVYIDANVINDKITAVVKVEL